MIGLRLGLLLATLLLAPAHASAQSRPPALAADPVRDGSRDFDFEFGDWTMQLQRRLRPLTGSNEWVAYSGSSIVRKVWGGAANLGEIDLNGASGRVQGLTLRTYNSTTGQWHIQFVNARDGMPTTPMVGSFRDGRGQFYNQERLGDRSILVRFIFSDITSDTFRFEQSFSPDGGSSWEANWIATFRRVRGGAGAH